MKLSRGLMVAAALGLGIPGRAPSGRSLFRPVFRTGADPETAAQIIERLRAFQNQRPRPWRTWHGFSSNGLRTRLRLERRVKHAR